MSLPGDALQLMPGHAYFLVKAHLAELDEHGWQRFTDDAREAHRADIHQVLGYASLYAADEVRASLVYPLRRATYEALARRGRERSVANLLHGARRVRLELRGVPFGASPFGSTGLPLAPPRL